MTIRALHRITLAVACAFALAAPAVADILHLRSGARIRTVNWWIDGETLHYESPAGTIGIPRVELVRVEPSDEPVAEPEAPPRRTTANGTDPVRIDAEIATAFLRDMKAGSEALARRDFREAGDRFLAASRARPRDPRPRVGYALAEISLGRDELAVTVVQEGLVWAPESADLNELMGDLLNREERVEDAVRAWRRAFAASPNDLLREKILKGERERNAARDLDLTSTRHFTVRYDGELDDDLADEVLEYLEERHAMLSDRFRMIPEQPITVILYGERAFRDVTRAPDWVGGLYDGKVRVPLGGLRTLDSRARALLAHELTHAFVHEKTRGNCPRWLHEGLAQQAEGRTTTAAQRRDALARVRSRGTDWAEEGPLLYPAALSLVDHLTGLRGDRGVVELLESLGDGRTLDDALRDRFGLDYEALCAGWARALERTEDER
jgi:tetratricopeptide (TPR) repeat protein